MRLPSLLIVIAMLAGPLGAEPWSVERAVTTTLHQNPDVAAARHRIAAAEAMLQQADSAWQPQVILTGGYSSTNNSLVSLMHGLNQRNFGFNLNFNHPGWVDDLNVTGTMVYNLYAGGRPTAVREAARAGARAAEEELRAVQHLLAAEAVKALLSLRKAREGVTALEAGLKAHEANLANARLRFEAGQLLKADLLSLEVQTARTREVLSSARHGVALAARAFAFALGLELASDPIELADPDPGLTGLAAPDQADFSNRPEILSLRQRLQAAEALAEAARAARRPTVNAFVSGQADHGWRYDRNAASLLGGVAVEMNVFDGGKASGKVRQAAAEVAQIKEQLRKTTLSLGLEVEKARLAHEDLRHRLTVTAGAVAQAEESAALSRARFEKGALLTAELIGSESRLIEMRLSHTLAAADERIALIELRRAVGLPLIAQP